MGPSAKPTRNDRIYRKQFTYGPIGDSSTNSSDGITVAWIEVGIIRDLDAIASIESAKSDITCNDTYIVRCLNSSARHNKFIDNNVNLPYITTRPISFGP